MVKKRYKINIDGNIKDSLRVGKIKFSCITGYEPYDKTFKITQLKSNRDHYCRPAFYNNLENIPMSGGQVKMCLLYEGVDPEIKFPDWITFTKVNQTDTIIPIQYYINISENTGLTRAGKILFSYMHDGKRYSESYNVIQLGNEFIPTEESKIECNPPHIRNISIEGGIFELAVEYENCKKIREPFFSPYDMDWISLQEYDEIKSSGKITKYYNVAVKPNNSYDIRNVNLIFGCVDKDDKEILIDCNITQDSIPFKEESENNTTEN